jgi:hypothetical protein
MLSPFGNSDNIALTNVPAYVPTANFYAETCSMKITYTGLFGEITYGNIPSEEGVEGLVEASLD